MERNGRDVGGYRVKGYTGWWGYTGSSVTEGETWCQGSAGKKPMEVRVWRYQLGWRLASPSHPPPNPLAVSRD